MNKFIICFMLLLSGCGAFEQFGSHLASNTFKLNRKITLYACDGAVIKTWDGKYNIEDRGG